MSAERFEEWWQVWPANGSKGYEGYTRKKDKKQCRLKWEKLKLDQIADRVIRDTEQRASYDKGWRDSKGAFLSAPLVYLNNERWEDGGFNDIRKRAEDSQKPPPLKEEIDTGPELNRYERAANQIMFRVAYCGSRGFHPLGEEVLQRVLDRKQQVLDNFSQMTPGEDFDDKFFIERMYQALGEAARGEV